MSADAAMTTGSRMSNSKRFLDAYNKIDNHLRRLIGKGNETGFSAIVDLAGKSNAVAGRFSDDLKEYGDLRNAIVHRRKGDRIIAEPNDEAVREIEHIAAQLLDPPKVIPRFKKEVYRLSSSDSIAEAVKAMHALSFSQIPIYDASAFKGLLTANTVSRWLGASVAEEIFELADTRIDQVLSYAETADQENYRFLRREATVYDAVVEFQESLNRGTRLEAILITHSGKPSEALLGIITNWDLPEIYRLWERPQT